MSYYCTRLAERGITPFLLDISLIYMYFHQPYQREILNSRACSAPNIPGLGHSTLDSYLQNCQKRMDDCKCVESDQTI